MTDIDDLNRFSQTQLGKLPSPIKITVQLFAWSVLMSFVLSLFGLSFVMIAGWFVISPIIVGQLYAKKYQVIMPSTLKKYSAIYYMLLSCTIGLLITVIFMFILQTEKPIDNFGEAIIAVFLFFLGYFIMGSLVVYFFLGVGNKQA